MGMCKLMVLVLFSEGATALSFRDFLWGPNWLRPILNLWKKVSIPAQAPAAQPQMPNNVIPAQAPVNSVNSIPKCLGEREFGTPGQRDLENSLSFRDSSSDEYTELELVERVFADGTVCWGEVVKRADSLSGTEYSSIECDGNGVIVSKNKPVLEGGQRLTASPAELDEDAAWHAVRQQYERGFLGSNQDATRK